MPSLENAGHREVQQQLVYTHVLYSIRTFWIQAKGTFASWLTTQGWLGAHLWRGQLRRGGPQTIWLNLAIISQNKPLNNLEEGAPTRGAPEVFLQPPPGGGAASVPVPAGGLRCWLAWPTAARVAIDSLEPCPGVWTVREC